MTIQHNTLLLLSALSLVFAVGCGTAVGIDVPIQDAKVYSVDDYEAYCDAPRNASVCLNCTIDIANSDVTSKIPEEILQRFKLNANSPPADHQFAYRCFVKKADLASQLGTGEVVEIASADDLRKHREVIESFASALDSHALAYAGSEPLAVIDRAYLIFTEEFWSSLSNCKSHLNKLIQSIDRFADSNNQSEDAESTRLAASKVIELLDTILQDTKTMEKFRDQLNAKHWPTMHAAVVFEPFDHCTRVNVLASWSVGDRQQLHDELSRLGDGPAAAWAADREIKAMQAFLSDESAKEESSKREERIQSARDLCDVAIEKDPKCGNYVKAKFYAALNDPQRIDSLRAASRHGHPASMNQLGIALFEGNQTQRSIYLAEKEFRKAFDSGLTSVSLRLGQTLILQGKRKQLRALCQGPEMSLDPGAVYKLADTYFDYAPRFARELMQIAKQSATEIDNVSLISTIEKRLSETRPSVIAENARRAAAAQQNAADRIRQEQEYRRIQQEVDEQMYYQQWLEKQR